MKIKTFENLDYLQYIEREINEMIKKEEIDKIISFNYQYSNDCGYSGVLIYEETIKFKNIDEFKG